MSKSVERPYFTRSRWKRGLIHFVQLCCRAKRSNTLPTATSTDATPTDHIPIDGTSADGTSTNHMINPQTQCKLFALPAELRNRIYTKTLRIHDLDPHGEVELDKRRNAPPSVLSLLQTCRRINDEACGIFYILQDLSINYNEHRYKLLPRPNPRFVSRVTDLGEGTLREFVAVLNPKRRDAIHTLTVYVPGRIIDPTIHTFELLQSFQGLKRLLIVADGPRAYLGPRLGEMPQSKQRRMRDDLQKAIRLLPVGVEKIRFCVNGLRVRRPSAAVDWDAEDEGFRKDYWWPRLREQYVEIERFMNETFQEGRKGIGATYHS